MYEGNWSETLLGTVFVFICSNIWEPRFAIISIMLEKCFNSYIFSSYIRLIKVDFEFVFLYDEYNGIFL